MDLILNSTFRIIERDTSLKSPLPGVYRVLLDAPASDLVCTVLIQQDDDIAQRPQTGRKRKKDSDLRRPRKKSPRPLVGRPCWLARSELERMFKSRTLIFVTVERRLVLKPAVQHRSNVELVGKTATELEYEDRVTKMASFLDLVHLQESLLMHSGLGGLVKETIQMHRVSRYFVYKHWSALCKWGLHESSLYPDRANCGAPGVARTCDPPAEGLPARQKAGRKTLQQRIARSHGITLADQQLGMIKDWTVRILAADRQIATPKPKMPERVKTIMASAFVSKILDVGGTVEYILPERGTYPNNRQITRVLTRDLSRLEKLIENTTLRHFQSQMRGLNARNWKGVSGPGQARPASMLAMQYQFWKQPALGKAIASWCVAIFAATPVQAVEVHFHKVVDGVYAFIGETGARSESNEGLNANLGLVVTPEGAVLIDSGATFQGARQIHDAIRRVTSQPVKWVINTGGQDHRWLGNGYFLSQGAEVLAHAAGQADMATRGGDQLAGLRQILGAKADGTIPTFPSRWIQGNDASWTVGGLTFEFKHRGGAHTPGDMLVWLPQQRVVFSGDVVYVDRMLGVLPFSNTRHWLETFAEMERLAPVHIVPGHGRVTDLGKARIETRDYLSALRAHMRKAVDEGADISTAIKSFDAKPFMHLLNATELMPGNGSRTYLEVERE